MLSLRHCLCFLALLLLSACGGREQYPEILHLAGSNTIGEGFARALAEGYFRQVQEADSITTERINAKELRIVGWRNNQPEAIRISAHGTGTGFDSLAKDRADIVMASRPILPEENAQFDQELRSIRTEHFVALDGIAVVVHPNNPLQSLSVAQVMQLFSGKIQNWKALTGQAAPVNLYVRDHKSGTYDTFNQLVLEPYQATLSENIEGAFESTRKVSEAVAKDPNAIGFLSFQKIGAAKPLRISKESNNSTAPTVFSIKTESYPLSRRLYLYHLPQSTNPHIGQFVKYALTEKGQEAIVARNFVSPKLFIANVDELPANAPASYRNRLRKANRIPINVYFNPGSHQFDRQALDKLGKINRLLRQKAYVNRQVMLMGFSDNTGSEAIQNDLSKLRAKKVQAYLREYGNSRASAHWYGSAMPLASNLSYAGRRQNCRVEVWIR